MSDLAGRDTGIDSARLPPIETLDDLREYLDDAIRAWREQRDRNIGRADEHTAACYIDAFQSVRASMLGELLPADKPLDWAK